MNRAKGRVGSRVGGGDGCGEGSDGREWRQLYLNNNKERERRRKKRKKRKFSKFNALNKNQGISKGKPRHNIKGHTGPMKIKNLATKY